MAIKKTSEINRDKRILIIGDTASGKTHILGTFCLLPDAECLVITADKEGLDTLHSKGADPDVLLIEDYFNIWVYYQEAVKWLRSHQGKTTILLFDDVGAAQETARQKITEMPQGKAEEILSNKNSDEHLRSVAQQMMKGERRFGLPDFGHLKQGMESFVHRLFSLPFDVTVMTVLEAPREDPRTGSDRLYPALEGHLRDWLMPKFSFVGTSFSVYPEKGKDPVYCLSSKSNPRVSTKDRYQEMGRTWINPTAEKLIAHIGGAGVKETEQENKIGVGV